MDANDLTMIAAIVGFGIGAQWLARRLRIPSLLLLLIIGVVVGPVTHLVDPDALLGDALFPVVSLAVGVLLFEGGLALRWSRLERESRSLIVRLVTLGAVVTWLLAGLFAYLILDISFDQALLLGAILSVSGPTVVGPLLHVVRPHPPLSDILRWEGIVIDPIGATLSIAVLTALFVVSRGSGIVVGDLVLTAVVGVGIGVLAGAGLVAQLRLFLIPDDLEAAVTIGAVVVAFWAGETLRPEAGLFATTVMGLALANQNVVPVQRIKVFSETVVVLLIGSLFILLAARIDLAAVWAVLPEVLLLALLLIVVVRAAAVLVSTAGAKRITWADRAVMTLVAPRGIVAAATAALFAIRLQELGTPFPELVPVIYGLIVVLAVATLFTLPAARWLGVARPDPKGAALVGSASWLPALARTLTDHGVPAVLVAPGRPDLTRAASDIPTWSGPMHDLDDTGLLDDVRVALVASSNVDIVEVCAAVCGEVLGRKNTYVVPGAEGTVLPPGVKRGLTGAMSVAALEHEYESGGRFAVRPISALDSDVPLAVVGSDGWVDLAPRPGSTQGDGLLVLRPPPA